MWTCRTCNVEIDDDTWDTCWKCTSPRDLSEAEVRQRQERLARMQSCLRCEARLEYLGTRQFHVGGGRLDFWLGDLGELFVGRERYDVYMCRTCGKIEFFVDGVGEQWRPGEDVG
ncbi:MAG: hypothetical protein IPM29_01920 [Planctomycetes bacterium]|nr:hypothetical protein [Planctomycetota bacterium]